MVSIPRYTFAQKSNVDLIELKLIISLEVIVKANFYGRFFQDILPDSSGYQTLIFVF